MGTRVARPVSAFLLSLAVAASAQPVSADDSAVRAAVASFEQAWNTHDMSTFAEQLAADVDYALPGARKRGREAVTAYMQYYVKNHDRKLEVLQIRQSTSDQAIVVLRVHLNQLPLKDGKYAMVYTPTTAVGRWRVEAGVWRLSFFTSVATDVQNIVKAEGL